MRKYVKLEQVYSTVILRSSRDIRDSAQAEYKCLATLYIGHTNDTFRHFEVNNTNGGNSCSLIAVGCGNSCSLIAVGYG